MRFVLNVRRRGEERKNSRIFARRFERVPLNNVQRLYDTVLNAVCTKKLIEHNFQIAFPCARTPKISFIRMGFARFVPPNQTCIMRVLNSKHTRVERFADGTILNARIMFVTKYYITSDFLSLKKKRKNFFFKLKLTMLRIRKHNSRLTVEKIKL